MGITLRLVDSSTAAIVASATGLGVRKHRSFGTALFTDQFRGQVSMTSAQYLSSDMGLATSEAARKAVESLVQKAGATN